MMKDRPKKAENAEIAGVRSSAPPALKRSDARLNRERALEAARICFSDPARNAAMEDIAREAGVGVGTLYRAFGSRSALAEAVFADMLERLVRLAPQQPGQGDHWGAVAAWLRYYMQQMLSKRAMIAELQPLFTSNPQLLDDARKRAAQSFARVMAPAQEAGLLRDGLTAGDVMHLIDGIVARGGADQQRAAYLLDIVLTGIRCPQGD
jgi:AcrR family transcriptional regulator